MATWAEIRRAALALEASGRERSEGEAGTTGWRGATIPHRWPEP